MINLWESADNSLYYSSLWQFQIYKVTSSASMYEDLCEAVSEGKV